MISLPLVYTIFALIAYSASFAYVLGHLMAKSEPKRGLARVMMLVGLALHALVLSQDMLTPMGIHYDVFNLLSFTSGLMLLFSMLFSSYRPVFALNLIAIPVAALGLVLGATLSQPKLDVTFSSFAVDIHIILSLSAYTVLFMAAMHAILLWFQQRELKKKNKKRVWVNLLPSLQAMESLLFDLLMTGFVILTVALGFGFFTIEHFFAQHLAHKTVFSLMSWLVYAVLLVGHYAFGWRGQKAIRFTFIGFTLLALGFIGSKFVLEMILSR